VIAVALRGSIALDGTLTPRPTKLTQGLTTSAPMNWELVEDSMRAGSCLSILTVTLLSDPD
jgi:hypothetical protein